MTDAYLRLRFDNDRDGTGLLSASAAADGFSGKGEAYFDISELEEFAASLKEFPLPAEDDRRSISGGFGVDDPHKVVQEHLGISVYLADSRRGHIAMQVRMSTKLWSGTRPESRMQAVVEILTTYQPLSKFGDDILALVKGLLKVAVIEGQNL